MTAVYTFIAFIVLLSSIQLVSAGCAGEIFVCRGDKDPCRDKQCPQGQVCRVDNCRGCFAECEPPNMVHIMSLGRPNQGNTSPGSISSNDKVTQEAGPIRGGACACPRIFLPVCGTDGKKYDNECLTKCAKVSVTADKPDEQGNCKKGAYGRGSGSDSQSTRPSAQGFTCRCAKMYKPVCGTDGQFYDNECLAICEGVQIATARPDIPKKKCSNAKGSRAESGSKDSSTASNSNILSGSGSEPTKASPKALVQQAPTKEPSPKLCACPAILAPVCGADGKQYDNKCLAECAGVTWAVVDPTKPCSLPAKAPTDQQPAPKLCACPFILAPVCGSDGRRYDNKCLAECAGVTVTSTDPNKACEKPAPKACPCPRIMAPVCGSDGKRYNNKCLAECAGVAVTSADGSKPCTKPATQLPAPRLCPCPRIMAPVCGSDGKRYNNKCLAECAGVTVTSVDGSKPCTKPATQQPVPKTCPCPKILAPVCGADGKQYDNKCLAECAGVTWAAVDPTKPCSLPTKAPTTQPPAPKACPCPRILAPVCGVDGKRYNNKCLAECAGATVTSADASKPCEQPKSTGQAQPQKKCACPDILAPVCGSDGKLYTSECLARCAGVTATTRQPGPNSACPQ